MQNLKRFLSHDFIRFLNLDVDRSGLLTKYLLSNY